MKFLNKTTLYFAIPLSLGAGLLAEFKSTHESGCAYFFMVSIFSFPVAYLIAHYILKKAFEEASMAAKKNDEDRVTVNEKIGLNGFTKLMACSVNVELEEIKKLSEDGCDINQVDEKGYTALMYAASNGSTESVRLLLSLGANKEIKTSKGNTAIYFADLNEHWDVKKLLK